jgi:hypothetical protein
VGDARKISALENRHIERLVEERLDQELDAVMDRLEHALPEEEFVQVLKIVAGEESGGH